MAENIKQSHLEREYAKYHFASFGFKECEEYLDIYEKNSSSIQGSPHAFQTVISKSFVITYARPFTDNQKLGTLSDRWTRDLSDELRSLHYYIVGRARNVLVAHMDVYELNATIYVKGRMEGAFMFVWPIPEMNESSIPMLRGLLVAATEFSNRKKEQLRDRITSERITLEP